MQPDYASWPLVAQAEHHDACGVGFIASRHGQATHRILRLGVDCHAVHNGRRAVRELSSRDWADYIHYGSPNFVLKVPHGETAR